MVLDAAKAHPGTPKLHNNPKPAWDPTTKPARSRTDFQAFSPTAVRRKRGAKRLLRDSKAVASRSRSAEPAAAEGKARVSTARQRRLKASDEQRHDPVRQIFSEYDTSKKGIIPIQDFAKGLYFLGLHKCQSVRDIQQLVNRLDPNGSGKVHYQTALEQMVISSDARRKAAKAVAGRPDFERDQKRFLQSGPARTQTRAANVFQPTAGLATAELDALKGTMHTHKPHQTVIKLETTDKSCLSTSSITPAPYAVGDGIPRHSAAASVLLEQFGNKSAMKSEDMAAAASALELRNVLRDIQKQIAGGEGRLRQFVRSLDRAHTGQIRDQDLRHRLKRSFDVELSTHSEKVLMQHLDPSRSGTIDTATFSRAVQAALPSSQRRGRSMERKAAHKPAGLAPQRRHSVTSNRELRAMKRKHRLDYSNVARRRSLGSIEYGAVQSVATGIRDPGQRCRKRTYGTKQSDAAFFSSGIVFQPTKTEFDAFNRRCSLRQLPASRETRAATWTRSDQEVTTSGAPDVTVANADADVLVYNSLGLQPSQCVSARDVSKLLHGADPSAANEGVVLDMRPSTSEVLHCFGGHSALPVTRKRVVHNNYHHNIVGRSASVGRCLSWDAEAPAVTLRARSTSTVLSPENARRRAPLGRSISVDHIPQRLKIEDLPAAGASVVQRRQQRLARAARYQPPASVRVCISSSVGLLRHLQQANDSTTALSSTEPAESQARQRSSSVPRAHRPEDQRLQRRHINPDVNHSQALNDRAAHTLRRHVASPVHKVSKKVAEAFRYDNTRLPQAAIPEQQVTSLRLRPREYFSTDISAAGRHSARHEPLNLFSG